MNAARSRTLSRLRPSSTLCSAASLGGPRIASVTATDELSGASRHLPDVPTIDPDRIDQARRAATHSRLVGDGATEATADTWITAWEAQAAQDGIQRGSAYWQAGWEWIAAKRKTRRLPE